MLDQKPQTSLLQILWILALVVSCIYVYDSFIRPDTVIVERVEPSYIETSELSHPCTNSSKYLPPNFIEAAKRSKSSVVYIKSYEKVSDSRYKDEYRREKASGVIISPYGDIVTNYHVVANAEYIEITLEDKREYLAEVVGIDESSDLALLRIEGKSLPYLPFADSDSLQVGEWILAVGNPFGLQSTVTAGIISAKARNIDILAENGIESFIQSDAVINPGSSGGALVNAKGELIGISTAILSKSGNYEGLSFAVPSNLAKKVITDIKEFGAVQRGKIGVTIRDVDAQTADKVGLKEIYGVYIEMVNLNSAAAEAGLTKGDVIIALKDKKINSSSDFFEGLNNYRPGDLVKITFFRKGKEFQSNVILRNYLNTTDFISIRNDKVLRDIGIEIRNLNSIEINRMETNGIMVVSIYKGSNIANTNMEPGYIIQTFNGRQINDVRDFVTLLKEHNGKITLSGFYERYPDVYPYTFIKS